VSEIISEINKLGFDQQEDSLLEKKIDYLEVIANSYDAIFVINALGKILLANPATGRLLGVNHEELIGDNVRNIIKKGIYDKSPSLEALATRSMYSGSIKTQKGVTLWGTSTPLMDESGNVVMVVTNVRDKESIDNYFLAMEEEKINAARYKVAARYLSKTNLEPNEPVAESRQMLQIVSACNVIAKTDSTVMLIGESGTGKEVMARYIYRNSLRFQEPFIPVNCAAIPHELLESEFFGYVRGAFTGANTQGKPGLFEIADKGTLFLDEIAELPLAMQSKLLRVLENGEIQRLGDTTTRTTNVRLIAATNRDLKEMVSQKLFRSDLYYRLNVIPIYLPPLRERSEDTHVLANRFLEEFNRKYSFKKVLTPKAVQVLLNYNWPGNVRELRNVIERLVITSTSDQLNFQEETLINVNSQAMNKLNQGVQTDNNMVYQGTLKSFIKVIEKQYINQVLAECNGSVREAACRLGVHRTLLYRKIKDELSNY